MRCSVQTRRETAFMAQAQTNVAQSAQAAEVQRFTQVAEPRARQKGKPMIYRRIKCSVKGWCNGAGPSGTCKKCAKPLTDGTWWYRFRFAGRFIHESAR